MIDGATLDVGPHIFHEQVIFSKVFAGGFTWLGYNVGTYRIASSYSLRDSLKKYNSPRSFF